MSKPPAPAVPAATILLLRGDHSALEVFMVVRHHQIDFASGALVFPGGKVDPQDDDRGEISFKEFLRQQNLRLACDQLVPFAHWITPDMMPKRFDTHFFIADAPPDQVALHDGHESVDSVWITPTDALAGAAAGRYTVIFPTLRQVEKLGHATSPVDAIAQARRSRIVTVTPWTEQRADGQYLCIPTEAGYDVSEEKMPARAPQ